MNLRIIAPLAALVFSVTAACGGSKGDDDNADDVVAADARIVVDQPDAAQGNVATELGKNCTGVAGECPADAPDCVLYRAGATAGVCTLGCATTANNDTPPPAGSDAACEAQYSGTSGTPACAGIGETAGEWLCLVLCGTYDNMGTPIEFGECPNDQICTANVCNP